MWLTKPLKAVLAVSFSTAVLGVNSCLLGGADSRCVEFSNELSFARCALAVEDIPDLSECFDFIGRAGITDLKIDINMLTTLPAGLFNGMGSLEKLSLFRNSINTIDADAFKDLTSLQSLALQVNDIETFEPGTFRNLAALQTLTLSNNELSMIQAGDFDSLATLRNLFLNANSIATIEAGAFDGLASLEQLSLGDNQLQMIQTGVFDNLANLRGLFIFQNAITTIQAGVYDNLGALQQLTLSRNAIETIDAGAFMGLTSITSLRLDNNALTTLPAGLFEGLGTSSSLQTLRLNGNPNLQCVPTVPSGTVTATTTTGTCECTPAAVETCGLDGTCAAGSVGFRCLVGCTDDSECDVTQNEVCCMSQNVCEAADQTDAGACGDPHMTGFRGQKFDFVGKDAGWYAVVSDLPYMHLNMRITAPVPSVLEVTYITGISVATTDVDGFEHTIVISVAEPHSLESSCRVGMPACLAEGALHVVVDGEEVLLGPGEVTLAKNVAIAAVNLPGACRTFGFEKYWERKKLELLAQSDRKLTLISNMQDMSDWVLADPTVTNSVECAEYMAAATDIGGVGVFAYQSEHALFQIMTPTAKIRLSHGRLHQLPMRDPTDSFDLPDHLAWQMNMAIDHNDMGLDATGILGETLVPTVDENGVPIMKGMDAIRGGQEDYRVTGPLGVIFYQGQRSE